MIDTVLAAATGTEMQASSQLLQRFVAERAQVQGVDAQGAHFEFERQLQVSGLAQWLAGLARGHHHVDTAGVQVVDHDAQPAAGITTGHAQAAPADAGERDAVVAAGQLDLHAPRFEVTEQQALRRFDPHAGQQRQQPRAAGFAAQRPADARRGRHQQQNDGGHAREQPAQAVLWSFRGCCRHRVWQRSGLGVVHQNAIPMLRCARTLRVSWPYARSTRSGPTGLRQRTPKP